MNRGHGQSRRRIVILGGGMSAISTAWALTEEPDWNTRYDITLYQMGFRLGGKGASGRNAQRSDRIEEHGLHVWLGFYDNAFSLMRRCYAELSRRKDAPLARWEQAFKPHSLIGVSGELSSHKRWFWLLDFPRTAREPGTPEQPLSRREQVGLALRICALIVRASKGACAQEHLAIRTARRHLVSLTRAAWRGLVRDRALLFGLDVLDEWDLRDWLRRHGATAEDVESPFLKGFYDLAFAYEDGDPRRPNFAAGAALRAILRTMLTYKGAVFWKMQAGMGDVVFAPIYEVLRRRGVRFKFFHRVEEIEFGSSPGQDGARRSLHVERIRINRQATVASEEYEPLIDVEGLPCWPSQPRYEQLLEGDELLRHCVDLESPWDAWPGVESLNLEAERDFDDVVFGIPVGAVPFLCPSLIAKSPRWKAMTDRVRTVATQAVQLWFRDDLPALGWSRPSPIVDAYDDPLNTWADMSMLLPRESWPTRGRPASLAYLVGPLPDSGCETLGPAGQPYLACRQAQVREYARHWLSRSAAGLWPAVGQRGVPPGFNWQLLVDADEGAGAQRLAAQYLRANVAPSERYVQSVAGSTAYRLFVEDSGVRNFYPVGDWLNTGINSGDIEAATLSGLQAARAITGRMWPIANEGDGFGRARVDAEFACAADDLWAECSPLPSEGRRRSIDGSNRHGQIREPGLSGATRSAAPSGIPR